MAGCSIGTELGLFSTDGALTGVTHLDMLVYLVQLLSFLSIVFGICDRSGWTVVASRYSFRVDKHHILDLVII